MRDCTTGNVSTCGVCQKTKETAKNYRLLPEKEEHPHQMLRYLIRSFELQDNPYLDLDDPWLGIAAASFAMHSMYHTTLHMMPGQLIFGRDMILNMQYLADWTAIEAQKQELIHKNNIIENSKCIPHQYKVGDKVMLENHHVTNMNNHTKVLTLLCKLIPMELYI